MTTAVTRDAAIGSDLDHEEVIVRRGARSRLPIILAVHSTARGPAIGGCRLWRYTQWRDGLADALRLSAGMTAKAALAGLHFGGGKTVVALPAQLRPPLEPALRRAVLLDVAEAIEALDGRYFTGPDVGTTVADMTTIGEASSRVFCRPRHLGGSGDSSPHTAAGVLACLRVLGELLFDGAGLRNRRITVIGLGHVGELVARHLADAGADLAVTDIEPGRREIATELAARWLDPATALTTDTDVLVPAALGGQLTERVVSRLRCAAIAGPANNQLAHPGIAEQLHTRGIVWAPDYLVSAGGIVHATAVEIDHDSPARAERRVQDLAATLTEVLTIARRNHTSPEHAARGLVEARTGQDGRRRCADHHAP